MSVSVGTLPSSLARDGKMVRDLVGILKVSDTAIGRTVACVLIRNKGGEIPAAREALALIRSNRPRLKPKE